MSVIKYIKTGIAAAKKAKADDLANAAKKAKEVKDAAEQVKVKKSYFTKGVEAGTKQGAKKAIRKVATKAAAAGAIYYEGKTGNISSAVKNVNQAVLDRKQKAAKVKAQSAAKKQISGITKKVVKSTAASMKKK